MAFAALACLVVFGLLWPVVLGGIGQPAGLRQPAGEIRIFAFFALLAMQIYVLAGIWFDNCLLAIGLIVSANPDRTLRLSAYFLALDRDLLWRRGSPFWISRALSLALTRHRCGMSELDPVIHQPARLRIMGALCGLGVSEQVDFGFLRKQLELTDGNLGAHLTTLEESGYISVEKTFVAKRPKTFLGVTKTGRRAFEAHVAALRQILGKV